MISKTKLLYVDDEEAARFFFREGLINETLEIETASDGKEALKKLKTFCADIVVTDVRMPNMDGLLLLTEIKIRYPNIFVVIATGYGTIEDAVKAMKAGAYDYILKPFDFDTIRRVIDKITTHKSILEEKLFFGNERIKKYRFENIIGQDAKMFAIFQKIIDVADTNATVLINGESGTGKELIAEALHHGSSRRSETLIQVNCAAFTEALINSELFGHEKGAFTGAVMQKKGVFELASKGTIFLDEIGDIPIPTQISLLRVLESGSFRRVGGTSTVKVDTRVICATNKDLSHAIKEKVFREDLFYRINVVSIHMPPLRERKGDIPLLANYFLKRYSAETKKNILGISRAAMNVLYRYNWPGNVRELKNTFENAVIFCKGREIIPADLPEELRSTSHTKVFDLRLSSGSLPLAEATIISKVVEGTSWNLKRAAKELDIARGTLYSKMKKYGIKKSHKILAAIEENVP